MEPERANARGEGDDETDEDEEVDLRECTRSLESDPAGEEGAGHLREYAMAGMVGMGAG